MSYLYVTENGAEININGGYFEVNCKNGMVRKVPKETLEALALFGNISITTPCIQELLKRDIAVSYFSSKGSYYGRLESTKNKNIKKLKKQIFQSENEEFCLALSKRVIRAKINNQIIVLRRYAKNSPIAAEDLQEEIKLMGIAKNETEIADSIEELMGYEGVAAKNYFAGLSKIIDDSFKFKGRNKMPPKDPFNSMISLGYTLIMYEIYGEIENRGLSPYCGFLHKDHERHPTLASDLMEEWRAVLIDSMVMSLIQGHEISIDEFNTDEETGGVFITKNGMKIFLKKYESKMRSENKYIDGRQMSFRKCLWHQANELARAVNENDPDLYNPIYIR